MTPLRGYKSLVLFRPPLLCYHHRPPRTTLPLFLGAGEWASRLEALLYPFLGKSCPHTSQPGNLSRALALTDGLGWLWY